MDWGYRAGRWGIGGDFVVWWFGQLGGLVVSILDYLQSLIILSFAFSTTCFSNPGFLI